jgi:NAD(P)-dependent dehydrogenase (short-subunit alcohol dehydrogenase family)
MDKKLFIQAIVKYVSGLILVSILLFIPAGTLNYWNAWMFIGALCVPMLIVGIVLMIRNPELLRKRLNAKEKEAEQKSVILFGGLMFVIGFVVAGLDYRFQWLVLPEWLVIAATVVLLFAYASSKAGVIGLTYALARELSKEKITVNAIAPGVIANTNFFKGGLPESFNPETIIPSGRAGTPEDIATAILFLASSGADYITGEVLNVNGGWLFK